MVDLWPGKTAASTAPNNLVRCLLGAGASAVIEPMRKATCYGWAYSVLGILGLATAPSLLPTMKSGVQWRKRREEKKQKKEEEKLEKTGEARPAPQED